LSTDCARAREFVSVQLDGELPETELDSLETHLRFCPACSAWAEEVRDVTHRLRRASVEVPADTFVPTRHTRRWRVSSAVALGSAAALVATMFFAPGHHLAADSQQVSPPASRVADHRMQGFIASSRVPREDGRFIPVSTPRPVTFVRAV
jgi:predicted anti-sigma-YlaC factor YlaD